jgi:TatA/E family protein of Tat protein translocase
MPFQLGFGELILIFVVMLLLFGPRRLPEMGASMGGAIRDFRRAVSGLDLDTQERTHAVPPLSAAQPNASTSLGSVTSVGTAPPSPGAPRVTEPRLYPDLPDPHSKGEGSTYAQ